MKSKYLDKVLFSKISAQNVEINAAAPAALAGPHAQDLHYVV